MFFGESAANLDAKGRLAIPVKYRDMLADVCNNKLVITYNPFEVSSLFIYPEQEWQRVHDSVKPLSSFDVNHRNLQQKLIGSAFFTSRGTKLHRAGLLFYCLFRHVCKLCH